MLSRRLFAAVLATIFLCSIPVVIVSADNNPILISLSNRLPDRVIRGQEYEIHVTWTNTNQKKTYDGFLQLSITSNQRTIGSSDIILTFNGVEITPKVVGKSLQFQLPKQTFDQSASGILSVEIQHNTLGAFSWTIGIIKA
jgi:hypothetical protein